MNKMMRTALGWCEVHGKLMYPSRKAAREAARRTYDIHHKNAFRCDPDAVFVFWHIGALPAEVRHGHMSREDFFEREVS